VTGVMRAWVFLLITTWPVDAWSNAAKAPGCPDAVSIRVVYNCLLWPDQNWQLLVRQQVENMVTIGLTDCANIHVVTSVPSTHNNMTYDQLESLLDEARQLVASILPRGERPRTTGAVVSQVHENSFEYPGLHLLWTLAQV